MLAEIQGVKWINSSEKLASRWGRIMILGLIFLIIGGYTMFLMGMKAFSRMTTEQIAFLGAQTLIAGIMGALIVVMLIIGVVSQLK